MMRNKTSSSMQKTYDECYLICSTAVYFEGQSNETEALRSWRSALDRIYYHNAYKTPPDYRPKTETERALQESLREMELQCKERVTLLEALRDSRAEAEKEGKEGKEGGEGSGKAPPDTAGREEPRWIGSGSLPATNYSDLPKPGPPLPQRPAAPRHVSSAEVRSYSYRVENGSRVESYPLGTQPVEHKPLTPNPPPSLKQSSRTPSPDKRNRLKTTLRTNNKDSRRTSSNTRSAARNPPAASKAAGLAWDSKTRTLVQTGGSTIAAAHPGNSLDSPRKESYGFGGDAARLSDDGGRRDSAGQQPPTPPHSAGIPTRPSYTEPLTSLHRSNRTASATHSADESLSTSKAAGTNSTAPAMKSPPAYSKPEFPSYRSEYPTPSPISQASITAAVNRPRAHDAPVMPSSPRHTSPPRKDRGPPAPPARRPPPNGSVPRRFRQSKPSELSPHSSESADETTSGRDTEFDTPKGKAARKKRPLPPKEDAATPDSSDAEPEGDPNSSNWEERLAFVKKNLPKGVDPLAAKQIFNEIVVQGDEVHWNDVAGLDAAKKALKEAVVYPFLRPDLFMGLREPARGMLLFGPPGTGKTMLARAVATESRSTFFAISASSLTSKWLGDSEKLVRALFSLAKALAPSIIFVDEIDSLLSSRGGSSEHESTRRIKTEFLIQWSDLQRAAAGKEQTEREKREGDVTRVLVLAATNLPWAIDEAARRRFVRRQYIPLPESWVRAEQLKTLLGAQKHNLNGDDLEVLVQLTDGYSGSDITALAKDAAMGPLRSLGEALLLMTMDEIRPIGFEDFEASLINIRPSVSKQGLKEFEDWAKEFGERGG